MIGLSLNIELQHFYDKYLQYVYVYSVYFTEDKTTNLLQKSYFVNEIIKSTNLKLKLKYYITF